MFSLFSSKHKDPNPRVREMAIVKMSCSPKNQNIVREMLKSDPDPEVRVTALSKLITTAEDLELICQIAANDNSDRVRYYAVDKLWLVYQLYSIPAYNFTPAALKGIMVLRNSATLVVIDHLADKLVKQQYQINGLKEIIDYFKELLYRYDEYLLPSRREALKVILSEAEKKKMT
jgi:hypothetical protein